MLAWKKPTMLQQLETRVLRDSGQPKDQESQQFPEGPSPLQAGLDQLNI